MEDTWVATDALNRSLPGNADCGSPRTNRPIGMFYYLWHDNYGSVGTNWDVSQYLAAHPYTNPHNPWAENPFSNRIPMGLLCWGEPALGTIPRATPGCCAGRSRC